MTETVDVVVIGLGPGGEALASELAEAGLAVVAIEGRLVGGECPYWGCVPSKMMIRAAGLLAEGRRIPGRAGTATIESDWGPVARRIRAEATDDWDDTVAVERLVGKGARVVKGWARLDGPGQVIVGDQRFSASKAVVLNPGTPPWVPPIEGLKDTPYWTNREAIEATEVPASLVVLGGGAIGLELAQVYARFGSIVEVVEAGPRLLAIEEPEAGAVLEEVFTREGIGVHTDAEVTGIGHGPTGFRVTFGDGKELQAEKLLVATGRRAGLEALGIASIGLDPRSRSIEVDDHLRAAPGVWAIGDVTGRGAFTHVSMYQARIAAADILGRPVVGARYHGLPRVTFTDPEIGAVGITEATARTQGLHVRTAVAEMPSSARGWIHQVGNDGFIKLVEDADRGVLVGATSAGPCGGEVLGFLALAVQVATPVAELREMIFAYPTFHRAIETAIEQLG